MVVDTHIAPLEHGPKAFYAVGVRYAVDILLDAVLDRLAIRQSIIGPCISGKAAASLICGAVFCAEEVRHLVEDTVRHFILA